MNISNNLGINNISGAFISGGGGIDEEYKRIMEKLLALGITPTGNKSADKAKLREYEMRQIKTELGSTGKGSVNASKYLTVSTNEINEMKQKLQNRAEEENSPEYKEKRFAAENRIGAEQEALINQYFIKKKKSLT